MKKKLSLNELKVDSFVTSFDGNDKGTIKGGYCTQGWSTCISATEPGEVSVQIACPSDNCGSDNCASNNCESDNCGSNNCTGYTVCYTEHFTCNHY